MPIPVTVLTGFLGSGKTTLVNHILANNQGLKFAVIENEFGEIGIDHELIDKKHYNNENKEEIIEMMNGCICCTIRSDLVQVLKKLLIEKKYHIDAILIETTGLADPAPVAQTFFVEPELQKVCYLDSIITMVDAKHIIQHLDEIKPEGVENESIEQIAFADKIILNKLDLLTSEEEQQQVRQRIQMINNAVEILPCTRSQIDVTKILNIKGFSLERILEVEPDFLDTSNNDHQHDQSVSSLSLVMNEPMNLAALENWISLLLRAEGNNLFRYKGIIHVKGMEQKYIFQGIHMLFMGTLGDLWSVPEDQRQSKFVFIGKNLDKEFLRNGFNLCIANPLRFPIGKKIEARTSAEGYESGVIIKHWDDGNAYRILLDASGEEVWGPIDEDSFVRLPK